MAVNDIQDLKKSIEELTNTLKNGMREGKLGGKPSGKGSSGYSGGGGGDDKYEDIKAGRLSDAFTKGEASNYKQAKAKERDQLEKEKRNRKQAEDIRKQAEKLKGKEKKAKLAEAKKFEQRADANKKAAGKAGAARGGAMAAAAGAVADTVNGLVNQVFQIMGNVIKRQGIKLEATAELTNRAIQTYGQAYQKVAQNQMANITGNVLENAYNSLDTILAGSKSIYLKTLQDHITNMKRENELRKNSIETAESAIGMASSVASFFGPIGAVVGAAVSVIGNATTKTASLLAAQTDIEIKRQEEMVKAQENFIDQVDQITKSFTDASKKVNQSFLDVTTKTFGFGRSMFLSGENIQKYSEEIVKGINTELAKMNLSNEDYYAMQGSYNEMAGGRANIIGTLEAQGMGALSKVLGISPDEVGSINGALNVFNMSIEDGNQLIYDMSKNAAKMGLNTTKFAKDLQKNLKLAEKYQFKDGVKGLMKMSAWAQKMRVDMNSIMNSANGLHTGNIEDTIKRSAQLNVLGGNAAVFSDPLSMLYNAYADPEQYAKNIAKSLKGFGSFDTSTGMTKFNITEQMRIEAMAKAYGMSNEEMFNIARQQDKEKQIKKRYGNRFGDKTDFVTQNATWSKEKQQFVVKVKANNKAGYEEVGLNDVTNDQLNNIFPEDKQDRIIDLIREIKDKLSPKELQEAAEKNSITQVTAETYENMYGNMVKLAELRFEDTEKNLSNYTEAVKTATDAAVAAQQKVNEMNGEEGTLNLFKGRIASATEQYDILINEMKTNDIWKIATASVGGFAQALDLIAEKMGVSGGAFEKSQLASKTESEAYNDKELWKKLGELNINKDVIYDLANAYDLDALNGAYGKKSDYDIIAQALAHGDLTLETGEGGVRYLKFNGGPELTSDKGYYGQIGGGTGHWESTIDGSMYYVPAEGYIGQNNLKEVHQTNDLIISPRNGGMFETDPEDTIMAFKPGGSLDRSAQKNSGGSDNINITVNGTLTLSTGNQKIDLMELVRNDPDALRSLTEKILLEASSNKYGGRHTFNASRYTI